MEVINPPRSEFEPDKEIIIDHDIAIGLWHTLWESVQEIEIIIRHCEDQEYAEVKASRESQEVLENEKICYQIKGGEKCRLDPIL